MNNKMEELVPIALTTNSTNNNAEFVDFRIVGGNAVTNVRKYPWAVSLQNAGRHFCGASLIHPSWILTAKHCIRVTSSPTILIGGLDLNATSQFISRTTKRVIEHSDLDVALIELDQPVNDRTSIKVNNNPTIPIGTSLDVIGWGRLTENGALTSLLQEVQLPIVQDDKCVTLYPGKYQPTNHLCAGVEGGKKDACQGDSGGAILLNWDENDVNTQFLIGVTSWGIGCAREGKYGAWVRTSAIIPWITQNIPGFVAYDAMSMIGSSKPRTVAPLTNPPSSQAAVAATTAQQLGFAGLFFPKISPRALQNISPTAIIENFTMTKIDVPCKLWTLLIYILIIIILLFMVLLIKRLYYE